MKSQHAAILNALDVMQGSVIYAARRDILQQAECIIVSQENALAEKDEEIARLKQELQHWTFERYRQLETDLDQVIGEAVKFADRLEALNKNSSVHWDDVHEFLASPIVQSWRARQQ